MGWVRFDTTAENGKILIKKSIYKNDHRPIMDDCLCFTCRQFTRAYLHYLFKEKQLAYFNLACIHNIHLLHDICGAMQTSIRDALELSKTSRSFPLHPHIAGNAAEK